QAARKSAFDPKGQAASATKTQDIVWLIRLNLKKEAGGVQITAPAGQNYCYGSHDKRATRDFVLSNFICHSSVWIVVGLNMTIQIAGHSEHRNIKYRLLSKLISFIEFAFALHIHNFNYN
ncbi:16092_t:CDS:2, partial [Cetraspora pellucida]